MTYMWSKNKYIEYAINIMLFLLGMNFMHYGQLFLPLICLLIFIEKRGKFKVNNWFNFITLCLFSLSFFIFTKDNMGFYSVMGFTLPMAYYIGSNINNKNQKNIERIILLISAGMVSYIILNFIYELVITEFELSYIFSKVRRQDIWTGEKIYPTVMTMHGLMFFAISYYAIRENKGILRYLWIGMFIMAMIYNVALGRRALVVALILSITMWVSLDILVDKRINIIKIKKIIVTLLIFSGVFTIMCVINFLGIRTLILSSTLVRKLMSGNITERIDYLLFFYRNAIHYFWGGQKISTELGIPIHDLWSDTYDCAGIVTWLLLVMYCIKTLILKLNILKIKTIEQKYKNLIMVWGVISIFGLCIEPIMTGCSIYIICIIIIDAAINNLAQVQKYNIKNSVF